MKISVIGCGSMGKNHARVLKSLGVLDYIVEPSQETKKVLCSLGYDESKIVSSIDDTNSDAYVIATPSSNHVETALKLTQRKKHILIEKPAAPSAKEIQVLKDESEKLGTTVRVGHIEQFNPTIRHLKKSINKNLVNLCQFYRYSPRPHRINDTNVWIDIGVHDVDLMISLFGLPKTVNSSGVVDNNGIIVSMHSAFEFLDDEKNVLCMINTSWLSASKKRQIHFYLNRDENNDAKVIHADLLEQMVEEIKETRIVKKPDDHFSPNIIDSTTITRLTKEEPLLLEIQAFISSLRGNVDEGTTLNDALNVAKVLEASLESLQQKKTIKI